MFCTNKEAISKSLSWDTLQTVSSFNKTETFTVWFSVCNTSENATDCGRVTKQELRAIGTRLRMWKCNVEMS